MVPLADQRATFIYKNSHNSKQIVDLGHGTVGGCSRGLRAGMLDGMGMLSRFCPSVAHNTRPEI